MKAKRCPLRSNILFINLALSDFRLRGSIVYTLLTSVLILLSWGCDPFTTHLISTQHQLQWEEGDTSSQVILLWESDTLSLHNEDAVLSLYFTSPDNRSLSPTDHKWTLVIENQDPLDTLHTHQSHTLISTHLNPESRVSREGDPLGDGLLGTFPLPVCSADSNTTRSIPESCLPCPLITQKTCEEDQVCQCKMKWNLIRENGPFPALEARLRVNVSQRTPTDASLSFVP